MTPKEECSMLRFQKTGRRIDPMLVKKIFRGMIFVAAMVTLAKFTVITLGMISEFLSR